MKFNLSSRQSPEYLRQCDEIDVVYNDRNVILDLIEKYPNKTIILKKYSIEEVDWKEIENFNTMCQGNFYFGSNKLTEIKEGAAKGIKVFHLVPAYGYMFLKQLKEVPVSFVYLDAPLFFNLPSIKKQFDIPVRAVVNRASYYSYGEDNWDGVNGTWIRPEDLPVYEDFIDVVEFDNSDNLDKVRGLFRVYKQQGKWPGQLYYLINGLKHKGLGALLPENFGKRRLDCNQRCMEGKKCRFCWTSLDFANKEALKAAINKNNN